MLLVGLRYDEIEQIYRPSQPRFREAFGASQCSSLAPRRTAYNFSRRAQSKAPPATIHVVLASIDVPAMVKLSVILFLLASVVLSALEPVAPIEEMAMVLAESTNKVRELRFASFSGCYRSISHVCFFAFDRLRRALWRRSSPPLRVSSKTGPAPSARLDRDRTVPAPVLAEVRPTARPTPARSPRPSRDRTAPGKRPRSRRPRSRPNSSPEREPYHHSPSHTRDLVAASHFLWEEGQVEAGVAHGTDAAE
jgi:hypothetical protein